MFLLVGLIVALLAIFFWPNVVKFWNAKISPYIHKHLPENFAKVLTEFFIVLNRNACRTRMGVMAVWGQLKPRIDKFVTKYEFIGEGLVRIKRTFSAFGKTIEAENTVPFNTLPEEMRGFLLGEAKKGNNVTYGEEKETVGEKIKTLEETA